MKNVTRILATLLLPGVLAGVPVTVTAENSTTVLESRMRAEQLREARTNIRASLVPSVSKDGAHHVSRPGTEDIRVSDHDRRGVIEITPFPQKRVSFTP